MSSTTIAGGIGDILMTRLLFDTYGIDEHIAYNTKISAEFREKSIDHAVFVQKLCNYLFPNRFKSYHSEHYEIKNYLDEYDFKPDKLNISERFTGMDYPAVNGEYIVIHCKCRLDRGMDEMRRQHLTNLHQFLEQKKFTLPVFIIGDKTVSDNVESRIHGQISIYPMLEKLKENNRVFDIAIDECYNKPDFAPFMREIYLLKNAKHVFGLGWGGNFAMTWAVTDRYSFFMHDLEHKYINTVEKAHGQADRIVRNFQQWLDKMNTL